MNKLKFFKNFLTVVALLSFAVQYADLYSQHLFSIEQNKLSQENVMRLKEQVTSLEINSLPMRKNRSNNDIYSFVISSVENSKIILLNEQNGNNVSIIPMGEANIQFDIVPFFIEELKQGALGEASNYLVIEVAPDFSVISAASVSAINRKDILPRFFYGNKENVREALPQNRQIIKIFKEKPRFIPAFPNDPENLRLIEQLEEEWSYYVYMYKLPDGTLAVYDEHFNKDDNQNETRLGTSLQFNLSGNQNSEQLTATTHALELWSQLLAGTIPVDIRIDFVSMGQGAIGASFRTPNYLIDETYYPSPLANQLLEYNFAPNQRDIRLMMNSDFNFYYGITGNPGFNQIDWITVMLHEVTHGLGFYSLLYRDNSNPIYNGSFVFMDVDGSMYVTEYPGAYDRQLFQGLEGLCVTELEQSERAALMVSNNLFSGAEGSYLLDANNGTRVKIYAPSSYASGSSVSHWDTSVTFPTFMKYAIAYGYKLHDIGTRKIGILFDIGWTPAIINPYNPVINLTAEIVENNVVITWDEPEPSEVPETLEGYIIHRLVEGTIESEWTLLSDDFEQLIYTDFDWSSLFGNTYQYAVKAKYSEDNLSDVIFSNTLLKRCPPQSEFPFYESFENNGDKLPDCWTQEIVEGNAKWEVIDAEHGAPDTAIEGDYIARLFYDWSGQKTKLVMPPMNLTDLNNPTLTFWHTQRRWSGDQDLLRIYYKASESETWTLLRFYPNQVSNWTKRTIALPEVSDNYFIAFEGEANYGWGVQLDDISIIEGDSYDCFQQVSDLNVIINNSNRFATLTWSAPEDEENNTSDYNIYLNGNLIASGIVNTSYQYSQPVSIDESHDWCVTVVCNSGFESDPVCAQTYPSFTVSVNANPANAGNPAGSGRYQPGSNATVRANPYNGWTFVNWTVENEDVSTTPTYVFEVNSDVILTANFDAVGIEDNKIADVFSIYPNPVKNILTVLSSTTEKTEIEIYNSVGFLLQKFDIFDEKTEIDVSKLTSGIYFIKFTNYKGSTVLMFVKK